MVTEPIPEDAQRMIKEFDEGEEAARLARLSEKGSKEKVKGSNPFEQKSLTPEDAKQLARRCGLEIESGHGGHGIHLVSADGKHCSLPDHGGGQTLSRKVAKVVLGFIENHSIKK